MGGFAPCVCESIIHLASAPFLLAANRERKLPSLSGAKRCGTKHCFPGREAYVGVAVVAIVAATVSYVLRF
jgi:hypothetical protein